MKIDKIYRLVYVCEDSESAESPFFTSKDETIEYLEDMKEQVNVLYEDCDGQPFGGTIVLQCIDLEEVEDIDLYADNEDLSEWVFNKEFTESYQKDMSNAGISTEEIFGMWKDYEVE